MSLIGTGLSASNTLNESTVVHSHPEIVSRERVFVGTRVPARNLVDWLEGGYTLDEFSDNFPTVRREQAIAFLEQAAKGCGRQAQVFVTPD
jgi:uncharacterized protein (DUF433 family)